MRRNVESAWVTVLGAPGDRAFLEAPYRARHIRKLDPPWPACAKSERKNGLILLVIRGVDAGDDRS